MRKLFFMLFVSSSSVDAQNIGAVLSWKFNHTPGICTETTRDGTETITKWPTSELGPKPDSDAIATYRAEFSAAMVEVDRQKRIDQSNVELARWVEYMTVVLVSKGIVLRGEIPQSVKDAINARRAERGEAPF